MSTSFWIASTGSVSLYLVDLIVLDFDTLDFTVPDFETFEGVTAGAGVAAGAPFELAAALLPPAAAAGAGVTVGRAPLLERTNSLVDCWAG